ncbi:cation:dicarboxylate symporter family transporter [Saccharicrinis aurantiacus]|uniref:cation:dicarboxylate symporter family transporter n=1 Tax=Saccharicrinis aurantiacus TaxID=1849719 RepID=UPI0009502E7C|nr:cation:dicarboxylase symporter family transporter [Saccharicrinis aurantiacus]
MKLSTKILLGLLLGIGVGLFFGELCEPLHYIGDGFIGLMQMTVLPYIMVGIIANLGRMSLVDGKDMLLKGVIVLASILGIGVVTLLFLPLILPEWTSGSFFNPAVIAIEEPLNFIDLYIPSNPFSSMANNVVPAVVLFSIFLGIGLTGIKNKEKLLDNLDILGDALNEINKMVVRITPIGVFAIGAYNAGTMTVEEMQRLHSYIIMYSLAVILLGGYWLPMLINVTTGIKPSRLFAVTKTTMLTIFATSKIIIVLPQLIDDIKQLIKESKHGLTEDEESKIELLVPLSYPFPNIGTFVVFVFVPFVAWYMGSSFGLFENIAFVFATTLSSFVAPVTGIPFLLDLFKLPQDMFQLFVISSVYTDRIRVVLGTIHLIALTIITVKWTIGKAGIDFGKLIKGVIIGSVLTVGLFIGARYYLKETLLESNQYEEFVQMEFRTPHQKAKVITDGNYANDSIIKFRRNNLRDIRERGVLRVGYISDHLPYAYRNNEGELVGFDVEMAHLLAEELGVKPEFYRVSYENMPLHLAKGNINIIMSGVSKTIDMLETNDFSITYLNQTLAFIVPDYNRKLFGNSESLNKKDSLKIVSANPYLTAKLSTAMPNGEVLNVASPRQFFKGNHPDADALLFSAEAGAAWTLIYPYYQVVVPQPNIVTIPNAYPIPQNDSSWKEYVDTWIELKSKDGTIDKLFKHWVEGQGAEIKEKRWCIAHDVLGWL